MNKVLSVVVGLWVVVGVLACGSGDEGALGVSEYGVDGQLEQPVDHRPFCGGQGTKSEGWYWGDTGHLIQYASCADLKIQPECKHIGSRSEGWMIEGKLLVWDQCRQTVGLAAVGEACGEQVGRTCIEGLFCRGEDTEAGGSCLPHGWCDADVDCLDKTNHWMHDRCPGQAACQHNQCVWQCDTAPEDVNWGWLTVSVEDLESDHPYAPESDLTWSRRVDGAERIQLHFATLDTEQQSDLVTVYSDRDAGYFADGSQGDFWTADLLGDTVYVRLTSDGVNQGWGFKIDRISYFTRLPKGACTVQEHCDFGQTCQPLDNCQDPAEPCWGRCESESVSVSASAE